MVSLFRYVLCMIALVPSLTVAAEASWGGWQSGGAGWRSAVAIIPYYGCYSYGYPYYGAAAAVIRLTGGYGYVPNYNYGCGYLNVCGRHGRRRLYAAIQGVRRVRTHWSAPAVSSLGSPAPWVPSSPAKTVQAAPAGSGSAKSAWTPMTVPLSPSPANEPPKVTTEASGDWAKKFQQKLNTLSPDMSAASALLAQEGFRVDSGNKSATGWFLTAHDSDQRRGSVRLQSDGTKIVLTVTG
ncbi:MAG: hypothetical protein WAK55_02330 [Xanthobacteraceae bacterium]